MKEAEAGFVLSDFDFPTLGGCEEGDFVIVVPSSERDGYVLSNPHLLEDTKRMVSQNSEVSYPTALIVSHWLGFNLTIVEGVAITRATPDSLLPPRRIKSGRSGFVGY